MPWVEGWIHTPLGFVEGGVRWNHGVVEGVGDRGDGEPMARGMVVPGFFNSHTHLADAVVQQEITGTLEETVAPPHGLKHRALAEAKSEEILDAMGRAMEQVAASGSTAFADFREGGIDGAGLLHKALGPRRPRGYVLGRPRAPRYDPAEVEALLEVCPGLGISAARDWPLDELTKVAGHVHRRRRILALHASEGVREDIDPILDLKPTLLVHMTAASEGDLGRCAQESIPIVVCPRSQAFFGRVVDLVAMARSRVRLLLGTDNAMLGPPSMLREMEFAHRMARLGGGLPAKAIVAMAWEGKRVFTGSHTLGLTPGQGADFAVLRAPPGKPGEHHLLRSTEADVLAVVAQGETIFARGKG